MVVGAVCRAKVLRKGCGRVQVWESGRKGRSEVPEWSQRFVVIVEYSGVRSRLIYASHASGTGDTPEMLSFPVGRTRISRAADLLSHGSTSDSVWDP